MKWLRIVLAVGLGGSVWGQVRLDLRAGWSIQSSAEVTANGSEISSSEYRASGWYAAEVPSTVLATLVKNKVYPDPYFGMNLRSIPGTRYGIGMNFANMAMPEDSPFHPPWWYRTEFRIPASAAGKTLWLNFDAINYRANIWLNGRRLASSEEAAGMYRMFEFNVTGIVRAGGNNTLAVEVFPPTQNDLGLTFVDWNPMTADKDMGLVRDVYLQTSGPVAIRQPFVSTHLAGTTAQLIMRARVVNATAGAVDGILKVAIGKDALSRRVRVEARESVLAEMPLTVEHPTLWWPHSLGPQSLQAMRIWFETGGQTSDRQEVTFGIREITSELDAQNHRLFKINGKKILIRGGGWTQDMMLRVDDEREDQELRYAQEMNLNTIRLEGKMMNDHFYQACDRKGILVIAGWCCCSYWERWKNWKPEDYTAAGAALRDQIRQLQSHPSVLAFLYGSDNSPLLEAEQVYLKVLQEEHWPNPYISSAEQANTPGAGPTGVKMTGPYEYVAPNYWLQDHERGGAFGFNTETSPGPAIPVIESLREMLPKEHWWPIDAFWNFHAGGGSYRNVNVFTAAMDGRYGKAKGLEDYVRKSQVMSYEGERAMFEAFGRNKYTSTGVVQWMLNNAWPSLIWHLYDYYLRPGGGYFGTKKANEPLHVQYSYDDQSIVVVNSYYRAFAACKVTAKVYNLDLTEKFSKVVTLDIPEDSSTTALKLPAMEGLSRTYFVKLSLQDRSAKLVSSNFYWLSTQPDVSNWSKGNGRYTPIATYADLKDLESLPQAEVTVAARTESHGDDELVGVTVHNSAPNLAFFVHLTLRNGKDGEDLRPVYWDDNYFEMLPGETRIISASYQRRLQSEKIMVDLDGWNIKSQSQEIGATNAHQ